MFPRRSQFGRIHTLANPSVWENNAGHAHFISFKSGLTKRICRSTFRAETHCMVCAFEMTGHLRAVIRSPKGDFECKDWEALAAQALKSIWISDCQSLCDSLTNPVAAGCEDKPLEVDLEGVREDFRGYADGSPKDSLSE